MRIKVIEVSQLNESGNPLVHFVTSLGSGWAEWSESDPAVFTEYEVELDIEEELVWGDTICEVAKQKAAIFYDNDRWTIQGWLESIEPDGLIFLRLGDSLAILETAGKAPAPGAFVRVRTGKVILFPHDIYESGSSATQYHDHYFAGEIQTEMPALRVQEEASAEFSIPQYEDVFDFETYKKALEQVGVYRQKIDTVWEIVSAYPKSERDKTPEQAQYGALIGQLLTLNREFRRRLPVQLLARCPYCLTRVLQPFDSFSLAGFYEGFQLYKLYEGGYEWHTGKWSQNRCHHALFTTPFVNLNDLQPDDVPAWILKSGSLGIDSQPFDCSPYIVVWPLIAKETSAVIHSLPIGRLDDSQPVPRYTAYFVTYFADDASNVRSMWVSGGSESGSLVPATGGVAIDLDLLKWVRAKRLFWLNPKSPEQLVQESPEMFPYANVQPTGWYRILGGGQIDGPHPYIDDMDKWVST
jgi:hypothetical protein